jgi:hypothetical protein
LGFNHNLRECFLWQGKWREKIANNQKMNQKYKRFVKLKKTIDDLKNGEYQKDGLKIGAKTRKYF